jgi:hypothetical protein
MAASRQRAARWALGALGAAATRCRQQAAGSRQQLATGNWQLVSYYQPQPRPAGGGARGIGHARQPRASSTGLEFHHHPATHTHQHRHQSVTKKMQLPRLPRPLVFSIFKAPLPCLGCQSLFASYKPATAIHNGQRSLRLVINAVPDSSSSWKL